MKHATAKIPASRDDAHAVLPKAAREYGEKVSSDRKLAVKFLKEAGIIVKAGKLAPNYR